MSSLRSTLIICPKCERLNRVDLEKALMAAPICGACKAELPFHEGVQDISSKSLTKLLALADRPIVVDFFGAMVWPL